MEPANGLFRKFGFLLLLLVGLGKFAAAQSWVQLAPAGGPPPVKFFGASVVYDPSTNRLILFGGNNGATTTNDVWVLTNANGLGGTPTWTQLAPVGGPPAPRDNHAAVYDSANNRMIIFGGCEGGCLPALNDVWVLANANGLGGTPTWTQLAPSGGPPAPRIAMASAYDPSSNDLIIFGGQDGGGFAGATFPEVWTLSNANGLGGTPVWTNAPFTGGPAPGQYLMSYALDSANNRLMVAGGDANGTGLPSNAVWVLANANNTNATTPAWTDLIAENPPGPPPDFESRPAGFDPVTGRMILVGDARDGTANLDAWLVNNANGTSSPSSWTQLLPTGGPPPASEGAEASAYDPSSNRLIVFFGVIENSVVTNQVWVLTSANGSPQVPINIFSTGVASDGTLLPGGAIDPHYTVAPPGAAAGSAFVVQPTGFPLCVDVPCPWIPDGPNSNWIDPFGPIPSSGIPVGDYVYTTTFDLTGLNPATAVLNGQWLTDNNGVEITLNGNVFPFTTPFTSFTGPFSPFTINSGFVPGVNTLQFVVFEDGFVTGLRVEVSGTAQAIAPTDKIAPTTTAMQSPAPNAAGWNNTNVTVSFTATDETGGSGVKQITFSATGAQPIASTIVAGATASVNITSEGVTVISYFATDNAGNVEATRTLAIQLDKTPPAFNCGSPDGAWHAGDVTIACTAGDGGSGLDSNSPANFTLVTSVPPGTETAVAFTNSRTLCDIAGNCSVAGPVGPNKVDKKPPQITIAAPAATSYKVNQAVASSYSCVDGGSGVATCAGPVPSGSNFDTASAGAKTFAVNATDNVGNASSQSVSYSVGYAACLLYDDTRAAKSGSTIPIKFQLCDALGNDVSSAGITVSALQVVMLSTSASTTVDDAGNANPDSNFRFDPTLGPTGGYIFNLQTTGLPTGSYVLTFTVSGDPTTHNSELLFQVR